MLYSLIRDIQENSTLMIKGQKYTAMTKSIYSPLSDRSQTYAKIVLSGHAVLVIVPYLDFVCIGHVENIFGEGNTFPNTIIYREVEYKKIDEDYQIVRHLEFGDPLVAEGEVQYADYINESSNISISLGFISRNRKRADIVQELLKIEDILLK